MDKEEGKEDRPKNNIAGGIILIVVGVLFLINQLVPQFDAFGKFWPLILIFLGVIVLFKKRT